MLSATSCMNLKNHKNKKESTKQSYQSILFFVSCETIMQDDMNENLLMMKKENMNASKLVNNFSEASFSIKKKSIFNININCTKETESEISKCAYQKHSDSECSACHNDVSVKETNKDESIVKIFMKIDSVVSFINSS